METTILKSLEAFNAKLNTPPPANEIKINRAAKNSQYLPISFVQMKLDELFYGQWETHIDYIQVIANEIVGHGRLILTHPITGKAITRAGAAAAMIQFKSKENGGTGFINDVNNKITNTLVKDFPHLYAEITKSAAKTLGKLFGRDLNREHVDHYFPESIVEMNLDEAKKRLQDYLDLNILPSPLHKRIQDMFEVITIEQAVAALNKCEEVEKKMLEKAEATDAA